MSGSRCESPQQMNPFGMTARAERQNRQRNRLCKESAGRERVLIGMASYEKEQDHLQKLLEENLTDEKASELHDNDESDQDSDREERQDTDSESEQDMYDAEEKVPHSENFTYMGKINSLVGRNIWEK
ncbi:hypothetical protein QE152_g6549 [Popillia japonica]|uniref:Uncharacterized protein n=1 Tax=Popillia japonica TaxID=7064 RepID=A0AAW1MIB1_POPJA